MVATASVQIAVPAVSGLAARDRVTIIPHLPLPPGPWCEDLNDTNDLLQQLQERVDQLEGVVAIHVQRNEDLEIENVQLKDSLQIANEVNEYRREENSRLKEKLGLQE